MADADGIVLFGVTADKKGALPVDLRRVSSNPTDLDAIVGPRRSSSDAHMRTCLDCMSSLDTFVPSGPNTATGPVVEAWMLAKQDLLRCAVEEMRGKVEVIVTLDLPAPVPKRLAETGRDWLRQRHDMARSPARAASLLKDLLTAIGQEDRRTNISPHARGADLSVLIEPVDVAGLLGQLRTQAERMFMDPGITCFASGPFPPYSFAAALLAIDREEGLVG